MAQDIIIRTWCDPCLAEDEHREGKPYPLANGLVVDVCDVHRKPLDEITAYARTDATAAPEPFTCAACGKRLKTERGLRKHRSQQHGGSDDDAGMIPGLVTSGHTCPDCDRPFSTQQGVSMHRFRAHGIRSENPDAVRMREQKQTATA